MKISAIVLTRNEENKIIKCLSSLSFADELIIIDNGSTDNTLELVKKFKCRVFLFKGTDFAEAREMGAKNAKNKWLLYVDADEVISRQLSEEIKKSLSGPYSAFSLKRVNYFYGKLFPVFDTLVRLIRRDRLTGWKGAVHETPEFTGVLGHLRNPLMHFTHDDISKMVAKTNLWSEIEAKNRFANNHPPVVWWRFIRVMLTGFYDSYIRNQGYKIGVYGIIESVYQSYSMFITYGKLWELQNRVKKY